MEQRQELGRKIYDAVTGRCGYGIFAFRSKAKLDNIPSYVEITTDSHYNSILDKRSDCTDMTTEQLASVLEMVKEENSTATFIRKLALR